MIRLRPSRVLGALALAALGCDGGGETSVASSGGSTTSTSSGGSASTSAGTAGTGAGGGGGGPACPTCADATDAFVPAVAELTEASGLVASAVHDGVFYAHNDSGDSARFFAIGPAGEARGTYVLPGAGAVDWEDMARGPCADTSKSCLYFADVGDNDEVRTEYTIYRVAEPATLSAGTHDVAFEALPFQYPDGPHNCEALLVHPTTGVVTLVTKNASATAAYEMPMPLSPRTKVTLGAAHPVTVGGLIPLVTGGDVHPAGASVLLRTYTGVFLYPIGAGESAAQALGHEPCELVPPGEQQGETIAWSAAGDGYATLSEGAGQTLHRVACSGTRR